jgi:hypothetical protein
MILAPTMPPKESSRRGDQPLYERAMSYIDRMQDECGLLQKEVAFGIGMDDSVYSQKCRGIRSHFYEDELEALAVFFRRQTKRPLIGFPHVEWNLMLEIDKKVGGWKPH